MALFGDDSAQYVTPDGRTVTLPSQIAAQFPGLSPVSIGTSGAPAPVNEIANPSPGPGTSPPGAGPVQLPTGGAPDWDPGASASFAAMTPKPTPADAASSPVVSPTQVPADGASHPVPGPVTSPTQATDAGPPNPPQTPSQADLNKYTEAQRVAGQGAALDDKAAAVKAAGTAEADKATTIGNFQSQVADEAARQTAARAKLAQDLETQRQQKLDQMMSMASQIQNTKIDREADHPVLAQIGIILGALGQTLNRSDHNLALDAFYKAIDRKVAGQMQNLEIKRGNLDTMRTQYGLQKDLDRDRLTDEDAHRIAYLDDAAKKMTAMGTQLESPIAKANMQSALADIAAKRQDVIDNAADRIKAQQLAAQARQDRLNSEAASRAVTLRGQSLEDKRFYYGQAQQEREHMATISAQMLERGDKLSADRAKRVAELGVVDPNTGTLMLTPDGQRKMDQADQLEAAARKATDPAQAQQFTQQAQQLRDYARINDAAIAQTTEGQKSAQKILAETSNAQKNIDAARSMIEADPSTFNRDEWAKVAVAMNGVKVNLAQLMGDRMSPKALESIDDVTNFDPSSMYDRAVNKGKAIAALNAIETQMRAGASTALLSAGVQTPWSPTRPQDSAEDKIGSGGAGDEPGIVRRVSHGIMHPFSGGLTSNAGQTAQEAANTQEPSDLDRLVYAPFGGYDKLGNQDKAFDQAAQAPGVDKNGRPLPPSNYGIDPADDARVRAKISEAGKVGNKKYGQIVETLAQPLISDRPSLATGVARLINDEDPKLLNDVLAHIAASPGGGEQKARALAEAAKSPAQRVPDLARLTPPGALSASPSRPQPIPLSVLKQLTPAQQTQYKEWLGANGLLPSEPVK